MNYYVHNLSILSVPDEGYSRNMSFKLKLDIYVFLLQDFKMILLTFLCLICFL